MNDEENKDIPCFLQTVEVAKNVNHGTFDTNESIAELYDSGCSPD